MFDHFLKGYKSKNICIVVAIPFIVNLFTIICLCADKFTSLIHIIFIIVIIKFNVFSFIVI